MSQPNNELLTERSLFSLTPTDTKRVEQLARDLQLKKSTLVRLAVMEFLAKHKR